MSNPPTKQRFDRRLFSVVIVAFAVRFICYVMYLVSPLAGFLRADHLYYRNWALEISRGAWLGHDTFEQGPLYAYALAGFFRIGLSTNVIIGMQLLLGITVPVLIYLSAQRLFDRRVALLAGLGTAAFGPLVFYECMLMKSFLLPVFVSLALYLSLLYHDSMHRRCLLAIGLVIGTSCLVRENYLLMVIPVLIWIFYCTRQLPDRNRTRISGSLLLFAGILLVTFPVTLRNVIVVKKFVWLTSGGGEVMYLAHGPEATGYHQPLPFVEPSPWREHQDFRNEAERRLRRKLTRIEASRYWSRQAWKSILDDPERSIRLTLRKGIILFHDFENPDSGDYIIWQQFIPLLSTMPSFGLWCGVGFLGMLIAFRSPLKNSMILGLVLVHVASILLTYNFGRFRIGMMPVWLLLGSAGIIWLGDRLMSPSTRFHPVSLMSIALVICVTVWSYFSPPGKPRDGYMAQIPFKKKAIMRNQMARAALKEILPLLHQPHSADLDSRAGQLYADTGYRPESISAHEMAMQKQPGNPVFALNYALDLVEFGEVQPAIELLKRSLQINPSNDHAHEVVAQQLHRLGELDEAILHYQQAVQLNPRRLLSANSLAVLLLTHPDDAKRNPVEALRLAQQVCRYDRNPRTLDTLAVAYAECGDTDAALKIAKEAMELARQAGNEFLARQIESNIRQHLKD